MVDNLPVRIKMLATYHLWSELPRRWGSRTCIAATLALYTQRRHVRGSSFLNGYTVIARLLGVVQALKVVSCLGN